MSIFKKTVFGCLVVALFACTRVPITSIPKLRSINLETTKIEAARVALKYPEVINFTRAPVKIWAKFGQGADKREVSAILVVGAKDSDDVGIMKSLAQKDMRVDILRIPENKVSEFQKLRAEVLEYRAAGKDTNGSINFSYSGACLKTPTDAPLIAQLYFKSSETSSYVHAFRNVDLREELQKAGISEVPLCS